MTPIWGRVMMKITNKKDGKEEGTGVQISLSDDGGFRRRDQVVDVDNHRRKSWIQVREER